MSSIHHAKNDVPLVWEWRKWMHRIVQWWMLALKNGRERDLENNIRSCQSPIAPEVNIIQTLLIDDKKKKTHRSVFVLSRSFIDEHFEISRNGQLKRTIFEWSTIISDRKKRLLRSSIVSKIKRTNLSGTGTTILSLSLLSLVSFNRNSTALERKWIKKYWHELMKDYPHFRALLCSSKITLWEPDFYNRYIILISK